MRSWVSVTLALVAVFGIAAGAQQTTSAPQSSQPQPKPAALSAAGSGRAPFAGAGDAASPVRLPVKRVVLYKNGVGFFEHLGRVRGTEQVTIDFTSGQLNDVLMSLTTVDLGGGKVTGVSFNTDDPASRKLSTLALPIGEDPSLASFLTALRGAKVEVSAGGASVVGRILSVEQHTRVESDRSVDTRELAVVTDSGEVRGFEISPRLSVRVLEGDLRGDIKRYLDIVSATRQKDLRRMAIATTGTGDRQLYVSYISEVPIWKSTYRLVMPSKPNDKPLLQGWAVVDNTVGEDWTNVELSLVAGAPQSFIQPLSQPFYGRRPVIPLAQAAQLSPQTHDAAVQPESKATEMMMAAPAPPPAAPAAMAARRGMGGGAYGGVAGGVVGGVAESVALPDALASAAEEVARNVQGKELGDLYEYKLKEPVTIRKSQSALVPIVSSQVEAERVSVWNASAPGPARVALWVTNSTPFTLDGGSFSVLEDATFTGEGLMETVKPGEKRLLSYAADLGLAVMSKTEPGGPERVTRVSINRGVMLIQRELRSKRTYTVRNEDQKAKMVIVEHPNRNGWKLLAPAKADETAANVYRFRVPVAAKTTATLTVEELSPIENTYQIASVTPEQLTVMVNQRTITPEVEKAIRGIVAKKAEVAGVASEISARNNESTQIFRDQERLRENLKALKGSAEEKALVTRYTRQLDDQESRLDAIKKEIAERESRRSKLQAELDGLIQALTFDQRQ